MELIIFNSPITVEKQKNNTKATPKKRLKKTHTYTVHSLQQCHNSVNVIEKQLAQSAYISHSGE